MSEKCELCGAAGGDLVWSDPRCRVVFVIDDAYPGYCRVIWNAHVAEFSQLGEEDRVHLMNVVSAVESVVRKVQRPDKINLASLGNLTPHLHWHIIPRWRDDPTYPQSIWAAPLRKGNGSREGVGAALRSEICKLLTTLVNVGQARDGAVTS